MSKEIVRKTYLCPIIGVGTREDPRRPKIADLPIDCSWFMHELKEKWSICTAITSEEDHQTIQADGEIRLITIRKILQLTPEQLEQLKQAYPKLVEKLKIAKECRIKFKEKYGE